MPYTIPKTYLVGEILSSSDMNTFQRDNIDDIDDRLRVTLNFQSTTLTDDTVSSLNTWEQWGTEEVTIAKPFRDVSVHASLTGYGSVPAGTGRVVMRSRALISFDSGSSYTSGNEVRDEADRSGSGNNQIAGGSFGGQHLRAASPSGDVKVKAEIQQQLGTAGDVTFQKGYLIIKMIPKDF